MKPSLCALLAIAACVAPAAAAELACARLFAPESTNFEHFEAPEKNNACVSDSDCMTTGSNNEICAAESLASLISLAQPQGECRCLNNQCSWRETCEAPECVSLDSEHECPKGFTVDSVTMCELPECAYPWTWCSGQRSCATSDAISPETQFCCGLEQVCVWDMFFASCRNVSACGIPDGCTSWYDGCNTCGVGADGCPTYCTKRACAEEELTTPYCQCYECDSIKCPDPPEGFQYVDAHTDNCGCKKTCGRLEELPPPPTYCCDPAKEPGVKGNPPSKEGHACCHLTGLWVLSIGDGKTFPCGDSLGPALGEACDKFCMRRKKAVKQHLKECFKADEDVQSCSTESYNTCSGGLQCYGLVGEKEGACCSTLNLRVEPVKRCLKRNPQMCGGIAGLQCPSGSQCVDDPRDDCDPLTGGADCSGVCCCEGKWCPPPVRDCKRYCKKSHVAGAKFYWHGERETDKFQCKTECVCEPCPIPSTQEECDTKCAKKGKVSKLASPKRNGKRCHDVCKCVDKEE